MTGPTDWLRDDPLRPAVAAFAEQHRLGERGRELDREPAFPWAEFRALGESGWLGLSVPAATGGRGLPLPRVAAILEELAYRSGTVFAKLALQPEFCSVLATHGSPEIRGRYFAPLLRGEILIGNQVTEPTAGSDLSGLSTRAELLGEEYVLEGTKTQAAFAADAQAAIVFGRTGPVGSGATGITAFLVPQNLPGIERGAGEDLGERWMRRGTVRYDHVRLAAGMRIGEEGRGLEYLRPELTHERPLLAAIYLGVARASWEETVVEVGRRATFGRPLSEHEAVGFPLVEDAARLSAAWLFVERTLDRMERGESLDAEAALAKWLATEAALTALDHAMQFHGGRGYSRELPHEQRWRDVRSGALAHGTAEIMHRVAARELWRTRPR